MLCARGVSFQVLCSGRGELCDWQGKNDGNSECSRVIIMMARILGSRPMQCRPLEHTRQDHTSRKQDRHIERRESGGLPSAPLLLL